MNLENKDLRNIETIHPKNKPAVSSHTSADGAGPAHRGSEPQAVAGKSHGLSRPVFAITGLALCLGLASCITTRHDSRGGGSVTVTSYRPGHRVNSLPGGYRSETISGSTYYYHDGYYYRQGSGSAGYMVVEAPRDSRYYDDYSRRQATYQTNRKYRGPSNHHDQRYERGEVITRLPDGYRVVNHRGHTYYQVDDRYYLRQNDSYVITTRPY